jgi:hypothetical protein
VLASEWVSVLAWVSALESASEWVLELVSAWA